MSHRNMAAYGGLRTTFPSPLLQLLMAESLASMKVEAILDLYEISSMIVDTKEGANI